MTPLTPAWDNIADFCTPAERAVAPAWAAFRHRASGLVLGFDERSLGSVSADFRLARSATHNSHVARWSQKIPISGRSMRGSAG